MCGDYIGLRFTSGDADHWEKACVAGAVANPDRAVVSQFDLEIDRCSSSTPTAEVITGHALPAEDSSARFRLHNVKTCIRTVAGPQVQVVPQSSDHLELRQIRG